jgi:ABC-type lipoprotein export system ATPase subunit
MIKRLLYSAQKSRVGKQQTAEIDLAAAREGRLKTINSALLESILQTYNLEQEATLATCVNLSAHLMESQKRNRSFWEDMLNNTTAQASPA